MFKGICYLFIWEGCFCAGTVVDSFHDILTAIKAKISILNTKLNQEHCLLLLYNP